MEVASAGWTRSTADVRERLDAGAAMAGGGAAETALTEALSEAAGMFALPSPAGPRTVLAVDSCVAACGLSCCAAQPLRLSSAVVDERLVCYVLCRHSVFGQTLWSLVRRPKLAGRASADAVCPLGTAQAAD